jgi:hypothetical protein
MTNSNDLSDRAAMLLKEIDERRMRRMRRICNPFIRSDR